MDNKEKFELYKQGKLSGLYIDEWTDEIKWFAITNNKPFYFDVSTLSNDMVIKGLKRVCTRLFNLDIIETHNIPDYVYIDFIRKAPIDSNFFAPYEASQYCKCEKLQKHDIILELALRYPLYLYYAKENGMEFTDDDYYRVADIFFKTPPMERKFDWEDDMPLADRHWEKILNREFELSGNEYEAFTQRKDCPNSNLEAMLKGEGSCIQYIHNPEYNLCKAAIDNNPQNIKYIDVKSEDVYLYALKKDKSVLKYIDKKHLTPKIKDYLGIKEKPKPKYPADYYVVKFRCNLADEGNLYKIECVKGTEMGDYLNKEFSVSFGNLEDNEIRVVKDYVTYKPITKEMYDILKTLSLDNIESGYFNMDYGLEHEKDDDEYEID